MSRHLVPSDGWVEDEDTLVCPVCASTVAHGGGDPQRMMENKKQHQAWHDNIINYVNRTAMSEAHRISASR